MTYTASETKSETLPYFDVIIIGAGLSGIGAGYHIQTDCPGKSYTILEGRTNLGGTWDLFRYPGIRSDSDMFTLGFSFYPWKNPKAIADGPSILAYIKETATHFGIDRNIRFQHRVTDASWSDQTGLWTLTVSVGEMQKTEQFQCRFLFASTGYYDYQKGYRPQFSNEENFRGTIIHPQHWDSELDYSGKEVAIIGSGATAVTLAPEMAKTASKVFLIQRTPTYMVSLPGEDKIANALRRALPSSWAYFLSRWKNILFTIFFYNISRRKPQAVKKWIQKQIQKKLGKDYDLRHFDPPYNPWDQRLCIVPDSDMFKAIKAGKVEMITDHIEQFTENGIALKSGRKVNADIIVTATGLNVQLLGGMTIHINGVLGDPGKVHCYRGVMFSEVPNFAFAVGYTNASWTLKCDLNCSFFTRLINYMDRKGHSVCTPRYNEAAFGSEPLLDFNAGYVLRAMEKLPRQGNRAPWKVWQNYLRDKLSLHLSRLDDEFLEYR